MAKCTVTLNVAQLGRAYASQHVKVADVVARDDGTYWTTAEVAMVPLADSPLSTVELDQGAAYGFVLPDGSDSIRLVPSTSVADFSDLEILTQSPGNPLIFALEPDVVISTDGVEPSGLSVGGYWLVDNPYLPTHGDLMQKTS